MEQPQALDVASREPKIELLELKEDFIKFVLWDTDVSVANALRRVMIGETPTMAIDLVTIEENTTVLHDEYFAHRLGMVPIRVSGDEGVSSFKFKADCFCDDFCPTCSIEFSLDVTNDGGEDEDEVRIVTSEDLKPLPPHNTGTEAVMYSSAEEYQFSTETLGIKNPGITLVKLAPGQSIKCSCLAIKGISKIHAKWCAVSVATFAYDPVVELNDAMADDLSDKQKHAVVESCPVNVFELDDVNGKLHVANEKKCMFCDECTRISEPWRGSVENDPLLTISTVPNRFIFSVETNGALKPEEVVFNALSVLQHKLQVINRKVDDILKDESKEVEMPPGQAGFEDTGGFL